MKNSIKKIICTSGLILLGILNSSSQSSANWQISTPIFSSGAIHSFDEIAVKDPSIVFYQNMWHLFYTARSKTEYTTAYVSAGKIEDFNRAKRYPLKTIRGKTKYGCAPQIFYFEPQKTWYLLFQNRDANYQPVFSTNKNISKPNNWSVSQNLLEKDSPKKWIDFWIIANRKKVYLFYTEDHRGVMMRSTRIKNFPKKWGKSKKVFDNVHEAVHVYKVENKHRFHLIYEINQNGVRSFGIAEARRLKGHWKNKTSEYATGNQLFFGNNSKPWTDMVSHGEAIRTGFNQKMEYNPNKASWLIQGIQKNELNKKYELLPWQLGIIQMK